MLSKQKALPALPHPSHKLCLSSQVTGGGGWHITSALHSSTLLHVPFPNWVGKLTTPKVYKISILNI